jgi:hypothetical protein
MDSEAFEPIRIVEVIIEDITLPRNDGTRGSGLHKVPFRLSRRASSLWAQYFVHNWDHPRSYTSMHRPGIARVSGDVLYLDGTTIEEIEKYHKQTLDIVLDDTNKMVAAAEENIRKKAEEEAESQRKQEEQIREAASKLKF